MFELEFTRPVDLNDFERVPNLIQFKEDDHGCRGVQVYPGDSPPIGTGLNCETLVTFCTTKASRIKNMLKAAVDKDTEIKFVDTDRKTFVKFLAPHWTVYGDMSNSEESDDEEDDFEQIANLVKSAPAAEMVGSTQIDQEEGGGFGDLDGAKRFWNGDFLSDDDDDGELGAGVVGGQSGFSGQLSDDSDEIEPELEPSAHSGAATTWNEGSEMLSWLRTMNLEQYGAVLVEQGCDAMQILRSMDSHDIKSLVHVARMKPLHAKVFEREIGAPCPRFTPGIRPFARCFLASKVHYPSSKFTRHVSQKSCLI